MFTNLSAEDETVDTVMNVTGLPGASLFPAANIAVYSKDDTTYTFYNKSTANTQMIGMLTVGSMPDTMIYVEPALSAVRPFIYNMNVNDTYRSYVSETADTGTGTVAFTADGWGMLHLPTGVFNNVLRIRMDLEQFDTLTSPMQAIVHTTSTTYMWYSNDYAEALLTIDSLHLDIDIIGSFDFKSVDYLSVFPTGIKDATQKQAAYTAAFNNGGLLVNGDFHDGKNYDVALWNMNGQKLYNSHFRAAGKQQSFDAGNSLPSGMYFLTIHEEGGTGISSVKLIK
jgi:hypothetical protein